MCVLTASLLAVMGQNRLQGAELARATEALRGGMQRAARVEALLQLGVDAYRDAGRTERRGNGNDQTPSGIHQ